MRHRPLVGTVATGHAGLRAFTEPRNKKVHGKDKRQLVLKEVRAGVEEEWTSRIIGTQQQGAWTRWDGAMDRKVSCAEIWQAEPQRSKSSSLGHGRLSSLLSVSGERFARTHPKQLPESTGGGPLSLEPRPGAEGSC